MSKLKLWPNGFNESIRWLGGAIVCLIALLYIEVMCRWFIEGWPHGHGWLVNTLNLLKSLNGLIILLLLFHLINKSTQKPIQQSTNSFPSTVTVWIGIWLFAFALISVLGVYATINPELISWKISNTAKNATLINESLITLFSAGIGSSITTLLGYLLHASEKKDFDIAFAPWYFARPIMGMLLGLIFYFALKGGLLILITNDSANNFNQMALAGVGALVGMFSKNAIEKLREVFHTLFTTKETTSGTEESTTKPETAPSEVVTEYFEKNKEKLHSQYKVLAIGLSKKEIKGLKQGVDCIAFTVNSKSEFDKVYELPQNFEYKAADGKIYNIPTDVREEEDIISATNVKPQPGDLIDIGDTNGTFGLLVKRKIDSKTHKYILSCFHVLCQDSLEKGEMFLDSNGTHLDVEYNSQKIAEVVEGKLNNKIDGALAEIVDSDLNKTIDHPYIIAPRNGIMPIGQAHINKSTTLHLSGGKTNARRGVVNSYNVDATIRFGQHKLKMEDLIVTEKMSDKGDSGSPVFSEEGRIVGLLVADSKTQSYIQPILPLIDQLNFEIIYEK